MFGSNDILWNRATPAGLPQAGRRALRALLALLAILTLMVLPGLPLAHAAFGDGSTALAGKKVNEREANPLRAQARFQPSTVGVGGTADLIIEMELTEGYRAYLDQFKLAIVSPSEIKLDQFKVSPIIQFKDVVTKKMKEGVSNRATMRALIEVPTDFAKGETVAQMKLTYQACTDDFCLFPKTTVVQAPLKVVSAAEGLPRSSQPLSEKPAAVTDTKANVAPSSSSLLNFQNALDESLLSAVLLMFAVGFLTSLTPCIYPMIPITLAVLGAGAEKRSLWRNLSLSLIYVLGLALTYSALGVVAASTGALFGSLLGNVWVVTGIALVFVAMGLSMYGAFEVQAPGFIRNRLGAATKSSGGYGGAFATGLIAGIVASPCVGPVLVGVLAYIAQTQNKSLGFALLFSFALGMGVLFIALGLSSSLIHRVPKAGPWMEGIKFFFGTVMIGMALYYIQPIYPSWFFNVLLGIALALIASFFGAFESNEKLSKAGRARKAVMTLILASGAALAAAGILTRAGALSGGLTLGGSGTNSYLKLDWKPYSDAALEEAVKSGKPVIIDFYADWCVACVELEQLTFTDPRIRELSNEFILLKIDATRDFDGLNDLTSRYKVAGLPTMIFYDAQGKLREDLTLTGFEKADGFLARMKASQ